MDKTTILSLGNPHQREKDGYSKMYENPKDMYCLVKLLDHYINKHLLPAFALEGKTDGRFFTRRAYNNDLKERIKVGCLSQAGILPNNFFGLKHFNKVMKEVALTCGFDNPEGYTMRANRRTSLTTLGAASDISKATVQIAGRHKSVEASVLYQQENEAQQIARSRAFDVDMTGGDEESNRRGLLMPTPPPHPVAPVPTVPQVQAPQVQAPQVTAPTMAPTFNPLLLQQQQLMQQQMLTMASMPMMGMGMMGNPMMSLMMQQQQQAMMPVQQQTTTVGCTPSGSTVYSKHDPRWSKATESHEAFCARLSARGAPWNWNEDSNPF